MMKAKNISRCISKNTVSEIKNDKKSPKKINCQVLDRLKNMAGSNLLIESQPSSFGNWTFNANTDNNKLHIIAILY
jgi:hypothetical protein